MELSIKQIIAFLVMVSGCLGAVLTFLLTLPPSEMLVAIIGTIAVIVATIPAIVKMLREMEAVVIKEAAKL